MGLLCFFFKQKTAYELRISDWSSDVCSSDLDEARAGMDALLGLFVEKGAIVAGAGAVGKGAIELPVVADMHPVTAPIAMIQSFYRFANALAIERGFDPDTPPLLKKVTETI